MRCRVAGLVVVSTDVTAGEAVVAGIGPQARQLLQAGSPNDVSKEANPFGAMQENESGLGLARAHRVSYVGELGWEIYVSSDMALHLYDTLSAAGIAFDLNHCGMHAMDCGRIAKGFRHFGHEITCADHVL